MPVDSQNGPTDAATAAEKAAMNKKLDDFKKKLMAEAESIVTVEFPKRTLEINDLLDDGKFSFDRLPDLMPDKDLNIPRPVQLLGGHNTHSSTENHSMPKRRKAGCDTSDSDDSHSIEGTKVIGFVGGTVPCNSKIAELIDITKPILRDCVEAVNKVKMWIMFLIPRIEDGNNFGVSIQEEVLAEVRNVEGDAAGFLDQMSRYFICRAKLVTRAAKYPHVDDYRRAIQDMDEKQFINIRLTLIELRNHLSELHDLITKNLEKIKKPRTSHMEHMY